MQTTINIDDQLLAQVQIVASSTGRTAEAVIEDALRRGLTGKDRVESVPSTPLVTYGGGGLVVDIDLDDSSAVSDYLDTHGG